MMKFLKEIKFTKINDVSLIKSLINDLVKSCLSCKVHKKHYKTVKNHNILKVAYLSEPKQLTTNN